MRAHMEGLANATFNQAGDVKDPLPGKAADFFTGIEKPQDPTEVIESARVMLFLVLSLLQSRQSMQQQLDSIGLAVSRIQTDVDTLKTDVNKLQQDLHQAQLDIAALDRRVTALERRP